MPWQRHWHRHPGVRSGEQLTLGERAADHMRNGMGSWPFVFLFLVFMGFWATGNSLFHVGGGRGFDPYPYILLNLMLSTMAGLQAAALLIAAKRADQIASEIAIHTERNTDDIKTLLQQDTDLTKTIQTLLEENTKLTAAIQQLTSQVHKKLFEAA
jgi:uncharacterized membrane protein